MRPGTSTTGTTTQDWAGNFSTDRTWVGVGGKPPTPFLSNVDEVNRKFRKRRGKLMGQAFKIASAPVETVPDSRGLTARR